jgi:FtsP/CotA-like multicopper oxidase with cupredoxin domain
MRSHNKNRALLHTVMLVTTLFGAEVAVAADVTVNLTAQRTSTTLPDSSTVPMWGYCDSGAASGASTACGGSWAPGPTITVAAGDNLTILLTNNLPTPTSLWITGQVGGGLGHPVFDPYSPTHLPQTTTTFPGAADGTFTPPPQGPGTRVRSFVPEANPNGGNQKYSWNGLKAGTYLYETATHPSIQAPMGLYGVLIVTDPTKYPGVAYDSETELTYSEIDPAQNNLVDAAATAACTASPCGIVDESTYPPAVNYSPRYFLINGKAFDKLNPASSAVSIPGVVNGSNIWSSGNILVRFVNAGLRSHTPSFVGLPMTLLAEGGFISPGNPKVLNEVMIEPGKTRDVVVKPAVATDSDNITSYVPATVSLFDRQLSMTNNNDANGGMQGFMQIAGGANGGQFTTSSAVASQFAVDDTFTNSAGSTFNGNVMTNDILITTVALVSGPAHGAVSLSADGNFIYTPNLNFAGVDTFSYNGNGGATNTAKVTLNVTSAPIAGADSYTSKLATSLKISRPGVLSNDSDPEIGRAHV